MKKLKHGLLLLACAAACPSLAFAGPVDVNSADAETISTELQGIGLSKARAIVEYRKVHGPFKSVDDLALVKGIGPRTLEINRSNILLQAAQRKAEK